MIRCGVELVVVEGLSVGSLPRYGISGLIDYFQSEFNVDVTSHQEVYKALYPIMVRFKMGLLHKKGTQGNIYTFDPKERIGGCIYIATLFTRIIESIMEQKHERIPKGEASPVA